MTDPSAQRVWEALLWTGHEPLETKPTCLGVLPKIPGPILPSHGWDCSLPTNPALTRRCKAHWVFLREQPSGQRPHFPL